MNIDSDTARLDWLAIEGDGYALVSDDNGHWACVQDGMQNCPMTRNPEDIQTSFFIEKDKWCDTVREAIDKAMKV